MAMLSACAINLLILVELGSAGIVVRDELTVRTEVGKPVGAY